MAFQTTIPTIPDVTKDNLVMVLDVVKQIIEVRENRRANQNALDRFASVRDMTTGTAIETVKSNLRVFSFFQSSFMGW
jgi:hypothetical protein